VTARRVDRTIEDSGLFGSNSAPARPVIGGSERAPFHDAHIALSTV
jgi:hypothetical protein